MTPRQLSLVLVTSAALAAAASAQEALTVPGQYATIQAAIDAAKPGETVVIAPGVYTGTGNRDLDYRGKDLVVRSARGPATCILDCQATQQDPHRGFLFENNETRAAVLEGFTIRNGATLEGAIADPFNGGAIRIRNGSSPTIRNCVFEQNLAGCWGGGVYVGFSGNPLIESCVFEGNTADDGGGFFSWQGAVTEIANCVFLRNHASQTGGAIAEFGGAGRIELRGSTIVGNTAAFGIGGILDYGVNSRISDSIVWGNGGTSQIETNSLTVVQYSNVQGGFAGLGNLDVDPQFRPDGYHLRRTSPMVDRGSPERTTWPSEADIDSRRRVVNGRSDIGADEIGGEADVRFDFADVIRGLFRPLIGRG